MNIRTTEELITELATNSQQPLTEEQKILAYEFAAGLFVGRLEGLEAETTYTMQQLQGMHALSHKQTFYVEYFANTEGRLDAEKLGVTGKGLDDVCKVLIDTERINSLVTGDERKQIAERSTTWAREKLVAQLARPAETDAQFRLPMHLTINYDPDKILAKAAAVLAYRRFYHDALARTAAEPDQHLADAKRALVHVHLGRLNAVAAVDVFPALLSLEEQLSRSQSNYQAGEWLAKLRAVAPAIGDIHDLAGEDRLQAREVYARHLDAIRQGAPFELDDVDGDEATLFTQHALTDLADAIQTLGPKASGPERLIDLGRQLSDITWSAVQLQAFFEAVLREWGLLSQFATSWQEADDRDGFADDGKFQVIITPRRASLSVDSTRRIVNIPEGCERPLVGTYPSGALCLVAHELCHVLQGFADYELGEQIPLARIKGRRYRILREAGGVYQEKILEREYIGAIRSASDHYLHAYIAKTEGKSRIEVARVFYESVKDNQQLDPEGDQRVREFAVNRTGRLYRHGGQNSQVLDYVEQTIVCDVLAHHFTPEQVNAFLLGSASFSLEDSALLHRFGLLTLPLHAAISPAHEVMRVFLDEFRGEFHP